MTLDSLSLFFLWFMYAVLLCISLVPFIKIKIKKKLKNFKKKKKERKKE